MPAMVAAQAFFRQMDDEPGAAAMTLGRPRARDTEHRRREPPAIDEDQRLFTALQALANFGEQ